MTGISLCFLCVILSGSYVSSSDPEDVGKDRESSSSPSSFLHVAAAILVTGGGRDRDIPGNNRLKSAEVLRSDGSSWCSLPDMIYRVGEHTQSGLEVCGGREAFTRGCFAFSAGSWLPSHTLTDQRTLHSSWVSPQGVVLLGGDLSNSAKHSTELLSPSSQTSTPYFSLMYDTT